MEESKKWPEYAFAIQGATIKFKLPSDMEEQTVPEDMFAFFKNNAFSRNNIRMLMANQALDKVSVSIPVALHCGVRVL